MISKRALKFAKSGQCEKYKNELAFVLSKAVRDATLLTAGILKSDCVSTGDIIELLDYRMEVDSGVRVVVNDIVPVLLSRVSKSTPVERDRIFLFAEDALDDLTLLRQHTVLLLIELIKKCTNDEDVIGKHINRVWSSFTFSSQQWLAFFEKNKKYISDISHFKSVQSMMLLGGGDVTEPTINHIKDEHARRTLRDGLLIIRSESKEEALDVVARNKNSYFTSMMALVYRKDLSLEDRYFMVEKLQKDIVVVPSLFYKHVAYIVRSCMGIVVQVGKLRGLLEKVSDLNGEDAVNRDLMIAWVALSVDKQPSVAKGYLARIKEDGLSPQLRAKLSYWLGRVYDDLGDGSAAKECYLKASRYQFSFYGQLAIEEMGINVHTAVLERLGEMKDGKESCKLLSTDLMLELGHLIYNYVGKWASVPYFENGMVGLSRRGVFDVCYVRNAILSADRVLRYYLGVIAASLNMPVTEFSYPIIGHSKFSLVDAVIRQEGTLNGSLKSSKGAVGLMQIMERTGKSVAVAAAGSFSSGMLWDDEYNVAVGQVFLKDLSDSYKSLPALVAAYNAGPTRVRGWLRRLGDPGRNRRNIVNWIESIPYLETRNYVTGVLPAKTVYDVLRSCKNV